MHDTKISKDVNLIKMMEVFFGDIKNLKDITCTDPDSGYVLQSVPDMDKFREYAMADFSVLTRDLQRYIIAGYDYDNEYRERYENYTRNFSLYVFNTFRRSRFKYPTYREYITDLCDHNKWDAFINEVHINGDIDYDQDVRDALIKEWGNFEY